ncbi:MAG: ParB/RepB/Spo0J family partition protein [Candidatus Aminicenantes bacterium]|nr:ParB/RepB/Spo0J family partition protein [Candidatus Aminicenantes bacterium]
MKKRALGKGLEAFLPEQYGILKDERFAELDVSQLQPNPEQPRTKFDPVALAELARSIQETGVLQPVVVVPEKDHYKIIVGERRWRAAQKAGLTKIPALIRTMTKVQQYEATLIENLQREDLNPMEIATAYQKMVDDLGFTQQEIADRVGKERASVANYVRLLRLPAGIQTMLIENKISMGHARALITLEDPEIQLAFTHQIIQKGLSVRNIEAKIAKLKQPLPAPRESPPDPDLLALQEELLKLLGTKVTISGKSEKGVIKIHYYSLEELNRIYEQIKGVNP